MPRLLCVLALAGALLGTQIQAQYSATYLPSNVPAHTEQGQTGTNQCGTGLSQTSECQNAYINSVTDFCLFAPPNPGADSVIGNTERIEVAWCLKNGTGARLIPDGAIKSAHFVQTPDFVQVTGTGDLTLINIPAGDGGGELDPHGADGNGNPIGGLVFSSAFGQLEQIHEWTNFVAADEFCFRACKPGPMAATFCQHVYDVMGCFWNMPANYGDGFENCQGDSGEPMGVYGTSTFFQGQPATPAAHPAPPSSNCVPMSTIGNGFHISGTSISLPVAASATSAAPSSTSSAVSGLPASSLTNSASLSSTSPLPTSSGTLQGSKSGASSSISNSGGSPAASSTSISTSTSAATRTVHRIDRWDQVLLTLGSAVIVSAAGILVLSC